MVSRVPFRNILLWNLKTTFRWQHFLYAVIVFSLVGWSGSRYVQILLVNLEQNIWDGVFVSFAGPGIWNSSIREMLRWFVPYLLFFYLIGDMAEGELSVRGYAVIPALGSRLKWWIGKVVTLCIFAIGYSLLGIGVVSLSAAFMLPWRAQLSPFVLGLWQYLDILTIGKLMAWIIFLVGSTLFAVSLLQITISIWLRKPFYAFVLVSIIMVLSWLIGIGAPNIAPWLPGSQSMLLRHTEFDPSVFNFSLARSLIYNLVLSIFVILGNIRCICGLDISVPKTDTRTEEKR